MTEIISLTSTSVGGLPVKNITLAEATVILLEEPRELLFHPAVAAFLYQGRHLNVRPYEGLSLYYKSPEASQAQQNEIVEGCILYLQKIGEEIRAADGANELSRSTHRTSLSNFNSMSSTILSHTPDVAFEKLYPPVRNLVEHCLCHVPSARVTQQLLEALTVLDQRDWNTQEEYWLNLLGKPESCGYAFIHILRYDPQNSALDMAIPHMLSARLRREIDTDALFLLADLAESREKPELLLTNTLGGVPDELQPQLIEELGDRKFSRSWIDLLPKRGLLAGRIDAAKKDLTS